MYHGTPWPDFTRFSTAPPKRATRNETASLGLWFTSDRAVAETFAFKVKEQWRKDERASQRAGEDVGRWHYEPGGGAIVAAHLRLHNPKVYEGGPRTVVRQTRLWGDGPLRREEKVVHDDPFEQMMDDRDQFASYIDARAPGSGGRGHWRQRMCAYDAHETNAAFVAWLQAQGHDGIWLRGSAYDGVDVWDPHLRISRRRKHDTFVVFEPGDIVVVGRRAASKRAERQAIARHLQDDGLW